MSVCVQKPIETVFTFLQTGGCRLIFPATGVSDIAVAYASDRTRVLDGPVRMCTDRYGLLRINGGPKSATRCLRYLAPCICALAPTTRSPYLSVPIRTYPYFAVVFRWVACVCVSAATQSDRSDQSDLSDEASVFCRRPACASAIPSSASAASACVPHPHFLFPLSSFIIRLRRRRV